VCEENEDDARNSGGVNERKGNFEEALLAGRILCLLPSSGEVRL
jgi:hypothetical protein